MICELGIVLFDIVAYTPYSLSIYWPLINFAEIIIAEMKISKQYIRNIRNSKTP